MSNSAKDKIVLECLVRTMSDPVIEQIKEKLPVQEVLKNYLQLTPAGRNFKARCPFHNEKTASFIVSPDRNSWHCFGCGLHGDIFSFVMKHENIEFAEALKILAEKAGVELRRLKPADYKVAGVLYDLHEAAVAFFRERLMTAAPVQEYLQKRKLLPQTIAEFSVGWAPNEPEALSMFLMGKGFAPEDIVRSGLAFKNDRGMVIDRFRGRVMFPIHNHLGKVVAFTGRIFPPLDTGEVGKYVNSPESPIFNKSRILYGYWKTKDEIRKSNKAMLVEGQMDMLMSYQAGIKNVAASSGTALTVEHLMSLRRVAEELLFSFDMDDAGWAAAEKALAIAAHLDFAVRFVTLPERFKDIADVVAEDPQILQDAVSHAVPAFEALMRRHISPTANFSNREDVRQLRAVLQIISRTTSSVERGNMMRILANYTGLPEIRLQEELLNLPTISQNENSEVTAIGHEDVSMRQSRKDRWSMIASELLSYGAQSGDYDIIREEDLPPLYQRVLNILKEGGKSSSDPQVDEVLNEVLLRGSTMNKEEAEGISQQLSRERLRVRREALISAIKRAESVGQFEEATRLLEELRQLK